MNRFPNHYKILNNTFHDLMDEILNEKGILSSELRNPLTCLIEQNSIMSGIFLNLNRPTEWGSIIPG